MISGKRDVRFDSLPIHLEKSRVQATYMNHLIAYSFGKIHTVMLIGKVSYLVDERSPTFFHIILLRDSVMATHKAHNLILEVRLFLSLFNRTL